MPLEPAKNIQIEKVPETSEAEAWANFNKRLNALANQGYRIIRATDTYILLRRARACFVATYSITDSGLFRLQFLNNSLQWLFQGILVSLDAKENLGCHLNTGIQVWSRGWDFSTDLLVKVRH